MNENEHASALRRKTQVGQEQFQARAMTAARALRVSMAKVAEDEFDLAVAVIGLTETRTATKPVFEGKDDTTLLLLLETPDRGPGAALLDAALIGALVQQQTMGKVLEIPEGAPARRATRTDAALVAPFLDSLFERAGPLPDTEDHVRMLTGLRFGAEITSIRLLDMALDESEYTHFSLTIDVDGGVRQGKMELLLPPLSAVDEFSSGSGGTTDDPKTLEPIVMSLTAQLRVALCRLRLPFAELAKLKPGDEIALPDGVMENSEILTVAGRKIGQGKLGQVQGRRAIRMSVPRAQTTQTNRRASDAAPDQPLMKPLFDNKIAAELVADASFYEAEGAAPAVGLPDLPGDFDAELPALPDMPGMDAPGAPTGDLLPGELPPLPGEASGGLPDLPDLPDLGGGADAAGGLPDLPDLPELPDLAMAKQA